MLILTRREGEAVIINRDVIVRVLRVRGGQVSIGVDAPRSMPVNREEVQLRIEVEESERNKGP